MSKKHCRITLHDEVFCTIGGLVLEDIDYLYNKFGYFVEGYQYNALFKLKKWDGKARYFLRNGKTHTLLLEEIIPILQRRKYAISVNDERTAPLYNLQTVKSDLFSYALDKYGDPIEMRPYQVESINLLTDRGNGVIVAGTGAGKTILTCGLAYAHASAGARVLIIVPSTSLIIQTKADFTHFKLDVGEYSGDLKDVDHQYVVSTWQTLKNTPEIMSLFQCVIVDEAHGVRGNVLTDLLINHGRHIPYRYGVTGTMPEQPADYKAVEAACGPVRKTITTKWLIDNGYLSTLNINIYQLNEDIPINYFPDYDAECTYLERPERALWIADLIQVLGSTETKNNVLVLVGSKKLGKMLRDLIPDSIYLDGDVKSTKRAVVYKHFEEADNVTAIATFGIASTGISIDRIDHLVLIDVGKSYIRVMQSIGRGVRKGRGKTHVEVHDIASNLMFSNSHLQKRIAHYKKAEYPYRRSLVEYV